MNLFKLAVGLSPLIISMAALGTDYTGHYVGTGTASDANGWEAPCTTVAITLVDTATTLQISDQAFACGAIGGQHSALTLIKKADGLYLQDKKVGSDDAKGISFLLPDEHVNDLDYVVRLNLVGGELVYREDWLSLDGDGYDQTFDMQSSLHKN